MSIFWGVAVLILGIIAYKGRQYAKRLERAEFIHIAESS